VRPRGPIVAIDGPAGSGKTSVSKQVARELGLVVLDTGALYRTLALATLEKGVEPASPALGTFCRNLVQRGDITLEPRGDGSAGVRLEGRDVGRDIRTPAVARRASEISAQPDVRAALLDLQRDAGRDGGVVVEGRDIGTVVFPDADVKFFLTASIDQRSERRRAELAEQQGGSAPAFELVKQEVAERDRRDSMRAVAPLVRAPDAHLVDSTALRVDEVVATIVSRVRDYLAGRSSP
jgi:cytidylate kinase